MSLTKEITNDKYEIVTEFKHIQVRQATIIKEDGKELSRTFHRKVLTPDMDLSNETEEIQNLATVLWTDEIKVAWSKKLDQDTESIASSEEPTSKGS